MRVEHWLYTIPLRLRSLFRRGRVEQDLDEELAFHLECRTAREVATGKSLAEARQTALRAMDGLEQHKERCRDARRVAVIDNLVRDVRQALRGISKNPGFAAVAVSTLALGIGANSAIFSVINAALIRPLPYPKPHQLLLLFEQIDGPNVASFANFSDWQQQSRSFSSMAAGRQESFNLGGNGSFQPEHIPGAIFSWALFRTLGVEPALGRAFIAADDRIGAPRLAVISYGLWQRRFARSSDVLRQQIRLNGVNYDVAGVMPAGFGYPTREVEVWVPIQPQFDAELAKNRAWHHLYVVARLRDGITRAQATAEVDGIQRRIAAANPGDLIGHGTTSLPLQDITTVRSRASLYVLFAGVGCLLLIACVNISNLLLARGSRRSREFSIRASLGASRGRLLQQFLTESLMLTLIGAVAGLLLAYGLIGALGPRASQVIQAADIDTSAPVRIDGRVLLFSAVISVLAGLGAGLLSARRSLQGNPGHYLKDGGRSATAGRTQQRLRTGLISAEVALSVMLLIAAGLMIRSFDKLQRVRTGVRADNLLTAGIAVPRSRYETPESIGLFYRRLLERVKSIPGVRNAGLVSCLPVDGYCSDDGFNIEGRPLPQGQFMLALNREASPEYFTVAGIPLLAGRFFSERDGRSVIVSESMARKFWPKQSPLGQRIYFGDEKSPRYEIVGIVGDVLISLDDTPQPTMYRPALQGLENTEYAVVDAPGDTRAVSERLRKAVGSLDPDIPAFQVRTMSQIIGESSRHRALTAALLGSFAALALILSAVGLYGVLSYLIAQRTAEVGIRMALGATRGVICRLVLVQGLGPALTGVVIGLLAAFGLARAMRGVLFGVAPADTLTFVSAPAILIIVAAAACIAPAWRATRVDPVIALRTE
jgi:predicted permease